ncbi:efflux RND transporter periplasmic adaptor subunit [Thalassospiraceae bacterium LMO-SO8]|nr:efflux RND transporter periplasmic adaptor subunit [Alphaproteobacteria bacterium LMO-S08]WND75129.1 efflux RND transporter periplasmic adaptor subunit [Thalassospiraceae bacterium LMO-SO8]
MNRKKISMSLLAISVVSASGFGLYRLGMSHATSESPSTGLIAAQAMTVSAPEDPSSWGIPEGEKATRRHMESGLKAGDMDPLTDRRILYYHDPMVPGKKFESPAKSPFMDMMLVPAYFGGEGSDPGTVTVSPRIQQNLGLRVGEVVDGVLSQEVSAVGAIAWNERGQSAIQARATGFVEKLHVRATLDRVTKGQPLFELYVPDWVAVQEDYLSLRRMRGRDLQPLIEASLQRMRQAGMDDRQIANVERTGKVQARTTIVAPHDGVVIELAAREGSTVNSGMLLARINDLSTVWAHAEVPESQVAKLRVGNPVSAQTPALPGKIFEGMVQALLPEVNPTTRTRKARLELANPEELLVPGMFVRMRLLDEQSRKVLLVPSEALIRTGRRTLVMAVEDNNRFRPTEVEVGREQNGRSEILRGLSKGQKVVLSGQFLIDSEASLKGVEARMSASPLDTPESDATQTYETTARVEAVSADALTLVHPEIKALQWPAMTMDFKLNPQIMMSDVRRGDEVEIRFQLQEGDAPMIVSLMPRNGTSTGESK